MTNTQGNITHKRAERSTLTRLVTTRQYSKGKRETNNTEALPWNGQLNLSPIIFFKRYFLLLLSSRAMHKTLSHQHTQDVEVTGQLRVNGKVRPLRRCTLVDQSLALKRKHRVHKYVNTAIICALSCSYSYSRKYPDNDPVKR